ncbi:SHOCT domain-containing protein [Ktedonosporobacter rubrisoli]|uniref:SHOCT domain-containing protein n=1 Tax=Ktedonosporobacter rubrisoli TaxID=2509675 RepID=A0A4P6JJR0_KTERU|nr:SHOCT domain-containing protein [Ktedonosporobacter rubrisoli]QBD75358.1 SHOCT domain-containing protein [Ktedonosporobacter rubrisoli]
MWGHWGAAAGAGFGHGPSHFFCMVLLGLLIFGAIYLFNRRRHRFGCIPAGAPHEEPRRPGGPDAMEALRQRYARGEIDTTTFEQMRERLGGSNRPPL